MLTKFYLFKKIRRANRGKTRTITNFDLDMVHLISKILKFIESDPTYVLKFKPVPGLVSAERVIEVRTNWQQACALAGKSNCKRSMKPKRKIQPSGRMMRFASRAF